MANDFVKMIKEETKMRIHIKTMICILLAALVLFGTVTIGFADMTINDSMTLGDGKAKLDQYLTQTDRLLQSYSDYYEFALEQLLNGGDSFLKSRSDYPVIEEFMVQYKLAYEDYLYLLDLVDCANQTEVVNQIIGESDCVSIDSYDNSIKFELTDNFLNRTLGEIRSDNTHIPVQMPQIMPQHMHCFTIVRIIQHMRKIVLILFLNALKLVAFQQMGQIQPQEYTIARLNGIVYVHTSHRLGMEDNML